MKRRSIGHGACDFTLEDGQLPSEQFHMRIFRGEIMGIVCDDNRERAPLTKILQLNPPLQHGRIYFHGKFVKNAGGYRLISLHRDCCHQAEAQPDREFMTVVKKTYFVSKGSYRKDTSVNRSKLEKQFERFAKRKVPGT